MSSKNIAVSFDGHLGIITIARDSSKNALDIETSKDIFEALKEFDDNDSIRCAVIQGNEKLFSPGADIKELDSLDYNSAQKKGLFNYFDKFDEIKIPIIALVEGYALGGGMELALICDFIVASTEAKFGQPEINLGLIPGIGGTQRLKKYTGRYNANFLCMSGEMISANEAKEMGFVSKILDKANFKEQSLKFAHTIAEKPKSSLTQIKRLTKIDIQLANDLAEERDTFYQLLDSENKRIGIEAFFEKKKPEWKD